MLNFESVAISTSFFEMVTIYKYIVTYNDGARSWIPHWLLPATYTIQKKLIA